MIPGGCRASQCRVISWRSLESYDAVVAVWLAVSAGLLCSHDQFDLILDLSYASFEGRDLVIDQVLNAIEAVLVCLRANF